MALPNGHWEFGMGVLLGIWVRRSGAWTKVTQVPAYASDYGGSGGQRTVRWYYNGTLNLGTGIEAFGVTLDGYDNQGSSGWAALVDDLTSVKWTVQPSTGTVSSAIPNGLKTTVTVRPK